MNVDIRDHASPADVLELFASQWWTADRTLPDVHAMLAASDLVLAAVDRTTGRLMGFARVLTDGVYLAVVLDVIVRPSDQGRGVGRSLLDAVVGHHRLAGVRSVELVCPPELFPFYQRWGFTSAVGASRLMRRSADPALVPVRPEQELLVIGGRSGVGKSTVGFEVAAQLKAAGVAHCLIEGDNLDHTYPPSSLAETNLTALWTTYAARGFHRLIYTNTASVLEVDMITRAMGGRVRVTAALLTAEDATARARLDAREIGSQLTAHVDRSAAMAGHLEASAPPGCARVATDGRSVIDIAREVVALTGWLGGAAPIGHTPEPDAS